MGAMSRQPGFFDLDDRYALLSKSGDPLVRPASAVNVEMSRFRLEKALKRSPSSGRTSTDRKEADRRAAPQGRHIRTQMNEALLHVFRGQPRQIVRLPGRDRGVPEGREDYPLQGAGQPLAHLYRRASTIRRTSRGAVRLIGASLEGTFVTKRPKGKCQLIC